MQNCLPNTMVYNMLGLIKLFIGYMARKWTDLTPCIIMMHTLCTPPYTYPASVNISPWRRRWGLGGPNIVFYGSKFNRSNILSIGLLLTNTYICVLMENKDPRGEHYEKLLISNMFVNGRCILWADFCVVDRVENILSFTCIYTTHMLASMQPRLDIYF